MLSNGRGVVMNIKLPLCAGIFFLLAAAALYGQEGSITRRAGEAFNNDNFEEAKALYLNALKTDPANMEIYLNLGYIYEYQRDFQTAIGYYQKGLPYADLKKGVFYLNMGNAYYKAGDYAAAEKMYTSAAEGVPPLYSAYLSRAGVRVKNSSYTGAISDYQTYLVFVPDTPKRAKIEEILGLLQAEIDAEETRRLTEEARRLEEEEKQRKLLESVLSSLDSASTDTKNLSAGTEDVETPEIELDIVE